MTTHSSVLAWRIPWTVEPGRLQSMGALRVDMTEVTQHVCTQATSHTHLFSYLFNKCLMSPNQLCVLCASKQDKTQHFPLSNSSPVRDIHPPLHYRCFPCDSAGKESACNVGDLGSIPRLGRYSGEGKATLSSILAQRIPQPVQSMGSQRVGHD